VCAYTKRFALMLSGGLDARWPGSYLRLRRRRFLLRLLRAIEISQLAGHLSLLRERADNTTYTNFILHAAALSDSGSERQRAQQGGEERCDDPFGREAFCFPLTPDEADMPAVSEHR
jgi:hypothetical protein